MGCNMSMDNLSKMNKQAVVHTLSTDLNLTDEQKQLVKDSWEFFEPKKTAIGRKMFIK
jgi:hypothetical protein